MGSSSLLRTTETLFLASYTKTYTNLCFDCLVTMFSPCILRQCNRFTCNLSVIIVAFLSSLKFFIKRLLIDYRGCTFVFQAYEICLCVILVKRPIVIIINNEMSRCPKVGLPVSGNLGVQMSHGKSCQVGLVITSKLYSAAVAQSLRHSPSTLHLPGSNPTRAQLL